jgi:hypothetical protein
MAKAPLSVRRYTFRELRKIAEDSLQEFHPSGELPVPIEEIVEFDLQLDIVPVPGLMSEFDIDAFLTADLKEIRVDEYIQEKVVTRYRASLAHEVAHLLVHREFFEQLRFRTVADWKATLATLPQKEVDTLESQAKLLGALLLVPPAKLVAEFQATCAKLPKGMHLDRLSEQARKIVIGGIARSFEVSPALLSNRLNQDRLL